MPDRDVTTIKDLIFYQYAKIIARSGCPEEFDNLMNVSKLSLNRTPIFRHLGGRNQQTIVN